jgi:hypothetical protein
MLGLAQSDVVVGWDETVVLGALSSLSRGVPPMIPPSRNWIAGDFSAKSFPISLALRGDMAVYYRSQPLS